VDGLCSAEIQLLRPVLDYLLALTASFRHLCLGGNRFRPKAGNGEVVASSESYKTKASAMNGVESSPFRCTLEAPFGEREYACFRLNRHTDDGQRILVPNKWWGRPAPSGWLSCTRRWAREPRLPGSDYSPGKDRRTALRT
jgi:hypothetical protein